MKPCRGDILLRLGGIMTAVITANGVTVTWYALAAPFVGVGVGIGALYESEIDSSASLLHVPKVACQGERYRIQYGDGKSKRKRTADVRNMPCQNPSGRTLNISWWERKSHTGGAGGQISQLSIKATFFSFPKPRNARCYAATPQL